MYILCIMQDKNILHQYSESICRMQNKKIEAGAETKKTLQYKSANHVDTILN